MPGPVSPVSALYSKPVPETGLSVQPLAGDGSARKSVVGQSPISRRPDNASAHPSTRLPGSGLITGKPKGTATGHSPQPSSPTASGYRCAQRPAKSLPQQNIV